MAWGERKRERVEGRVVVTRRVARRERMGEQGRKAGEGESEEVMAWVVEDGMWRGSVGSVWEWQWRDGWDGRYCRDP